MNWQVVKNVIRPQSCSHFVVRYRSNLPPRKAQQLRRNAVSKSKKYATSTVSAEASAANSLQWKLRNISSFTNHFQSNQNDLLTNNEAGKLLYDNIIHEFPEGIQMAFAYGSGAFQQINSKDKSKNMLDFIFVVDKPIQWHEENLKHNPKHYSFLKKFGPKTISKYQEQYGAGVYFNTLIPMHDRIIKYGVVSKNRVYADLLDWESLYISGRLHKPVKFLLVPKDENLITALTVNLRSALNAALLLLPDSFTEEQLYTTIAGLSYSGDFRMSVAEDNNKVSNVAVYVLVRTLFCMFHISKI